MRRLLVVVVVLMLGVSAYGVPRDDRESREREPPTLRIVKRVVKALGEFIVIPTPSPKG